MILRRIRIESFGGIRNMELPLEEGFQTVCQKNGWGKSTLAVFLKVMFFGFSGESARKIADKEREQLRPWSGGEIYGGSIDFTLDGREYELRRTFGKKASEDTLTVTDLRTNLPSSEFGEVPGEKIYGLDADSFFKTIYIAEGECKSEASDRINERIGNPTGADKDSGNLSDVLEKLKEKKNHLTGGRATGALAKLESEITGLRSDLSGRDLAEEDFEKEKKARDELNDLIGDRTELLKKKRKEYAKAGAEKALAAERTHYRDLKKRASDAEERLEKETAFFGGRMIDAEALSEAENRLTEMERSATRQEEHALTEEEQEELRVMTTRYPAETDEDILQEADAIAQELKELRERKAEEEPSGEQRERRKELGRKYGKESAVPDQVRMGDLYELCSRLRSQLADEEVTLKDAQAKEKTRSDREEVLLQSWEREQERADHVREAALERLESRAGQRREKSRRSRGILLILALGFLLLGIIVGTIALLSPEKGSTGTAQTGAAAEAAVQAEGTQTDAGSSVRPESPVLIAAGIVLLVLRAAKAGAEKRAAQEDEEERARLDEQSEIPLPEGIDGEVYRPSEKYENERRISESEASIIRLEGRLESAQKELESLLKEYGGSTERGTIRSEIDRLDREVTEYQKLRAAGLEYAKKGYEEKIGNAGNRLRELLPGKVFPEGEEKQVLLGIRQELKRLEELRQRDQRSLDAEKMLRELKEKNDEILKEYRSLHPEYTEDAALINAMQEHLALYRNRMQEKQSALTALQEYEAEHEVSHLADETGILPEGEDGTQASTADPEELQNEITALEESIEEKRHMLRELTERMNESERELDRLDEVQEELDILLERKKQYTLQYDIYSKTAKYLKQAKEEYLSSFIRPLQDAFTKHYEEISDTQESYRIDVNLNLSCEKSGEYHPLERQSSGYRDLAYLCLRLALVDIMYGDEVPLLIMDDPFVHMDKEKTRRALDYLGKMQARYQILYLTCRPEAS